MKRKEFNSFFLAETKRMKLLIVCLKNPDQFGVFLIDI